MFQQNGVFISSFLNTYDLEVVRLGEIVVFKCGGSTINELSERFFSNLLALKKDGCKPIIVHGGGPEIKEMLMKLNIETEFVDGLRKTTEEVMDVVEMVLSGSVNNALVRKLNDAGLEAVGLSGSDHQLMTAKALDFERLGLVGEVESVNCSFLMQLLDLGIIPVIAPIAIGREGMRFNINADTAAGAVAKALSAKQLIFVTDVPGILDGDTLLETVTETEIDQFISDGTIYGGMIPKVKAAVDSLGENLQEVMIVDGKHSHLNENGKLVGTMIQRSLAGAVK